MTANNEATLTGEERLKARRSRFLRFCAIGFLVAMLVGLLSGMSTQWYRDGTISIWILLAMLIAAIAGFVYFTYDYYRRVDELDLLDNLWANTAGLYGYFILFGSWFFLHDAGIVAPPNHLLIAVATMAILFIAYGIRKLALR